METVSCNYCGSSNYTRLYHIPDLLLDPKSELFSMVRCNQCGLLYQNPRPTQEEIERYYAQDYEPFYQEKTENWIMKKVGRYGVYKRCRTINSLRGINSGRLLDIGCSTGLFLNVLQQSGKWEVMGVEPSEYAVKVAWERYQLEVFNGTLQQANYPTGFFDVVTLWDVLEHLPDPSGSLEEISRITKPNGYLVMRVPNSDSVDAKIFGPCWAGLDLPRHYYVFSKKNIIWFLERIGYGVNKIRCDLGVYPTFILSLRFWFTKKGIDKFTREKIMRVLNHPISRLLSAPFFYFYGLLLLGSEITVIARKK